MKIRFLGTGTSTGVPEIGCTCEVCSSTDSRDKRMRCSLLVEQENTRLLIDCGPDFRQQILPIHFSKLNGILLTHEHYDHVGGLDDLRPFGQFGDLNVYGQESLCGVIKERMPYVFRERPYPGAPRISLHPILSQALTIGSCKIVPIEVYHGDLLIFGYRINDLAYLTDMSHLPERELSKLKGLKVLVIDALRDRPHPTHATVEQALETIRKIAPERAYLIHLSHHFGLHAQREPLLPAGVHVAYDGLEVEF